MGMSAVLRLIVVIATERNNKERSRNVPVIAHLSILMTRQSFEPRIQSSVGMIPSTHFLDR
jgi:hypothetical protein